MLLYMLPLLWSRSTLTLTMHESATCRLYTGSAVMDAERLWWEVTVGFGRAPPQDESAELRSNRQSEEELEGVEESEEEEEEEEASDTLVQELWKDWRWHREYG